jgi:hypothetical protein
VMAPIVLLFAPAIRRLVLLLTEKDAN